MIEERAKVEEILRRHAVILVVGKPDDIVQTSLPVLDPNKTYLMTFLEVE